MDTASVAYVLCRIEDDSSLTPVSEHENVVDGVATDKHTVEVEDFDFAYGLFADGVRVACFSEDSSCLKRKLRGSANRRVAYVSRNDGKAVESL